MRPLAIVLLGGVLVAPCHAWADVALMTGQQAKPLQGRFNTVPVLHSNQPEEVHGPGILVTTIPGQSISSETGAPLANATYTFNGEFGIHVHHKYNPHDKTRMGSVGGPRGELTLATLLINPSSQPVHIRFQKGAVRNSFEAPYQANNLMGVKPLGHRPWNTGPGDATAVQMLRGKLDRKLADEITIPAHSRVVLFSTQLPAKGIANALLKGFSDGPFQMAVIAAEDPQTEGDLMAVLDQGRLAPGRVYLSRIRQIENGTVFSRVAGVAIGDEYSASLYHDLQQGALHVPLTSTNRHHFGTGEVQINPLATRMVDSSLNNVGTYGVLFEVAMNLKGSGPHQLVLSHPTVNGRRRFTAFRGSIRIETVDGYQEVHVGMKSGQSLPIADLYLKPGQVNPIKVSLVYPADATPGHLLSVVPDQQLAQLKQREPLVEASDLAVKLVAPAEPVAARAPSAFEPVTIRPAAPALVTPPQWLQAPPELPNLDGVSAAVISPTRMSESLMLRYQGAVEAQQKMINTLLGR